MAVGTLCAEVHFGVEINSAEFQFTSAQKSVSLQKCTLVHWWWVQKYPSLQFVSVMAVGAEGCSTAKVRISAEFCVDAVGTGAQPPILYGLLLIGFTHA